MASKNLVMMTSCLYFLKLPHSDMGCQEVQKPQTDGWDYSPEGYCILRPLDVSIIHNSPK